MTDWVTFVDAGTSASGKTKLWAVKGSGGPIDHIGEIRWHGAWRKYIFEPAPAIFAPSCLEQIARFLEAETSRHFMDRSAERHTVPVTEKPEGVEWCTDPFCPAPAFGNAPGRHWHT